MKKLNKVLLSALTISILGANLTSCATASTYAAHKDLSVQSKMSSSVFLDPAPQSKKIIYVQIKTTTTYNVSEFKQDIVNDLKDSGWKVTNDPDKAFYMLQANVLQAGLAKSHQAVDSTISEGFSSLAGGAVIGTGVGLISGDAMDGGIAGLSVAGADYIGQQVLKDKTYSIITDVQISEKINGKVNQATQANLANGSSNTVQSYSNSTNWKRTRVRVGTIADKINLKLEDAMPKVQAGLAKEITGIFS